METPLQKSRPPVAGEPGAADPGSGELLWYGWAWLNWLLPIMFVMRGFVNGSGGWEALFLLMTSPVLVPLCALAASAPRMILRRSGFRRVPGPLVWLLFVHWWCWITFTITLPGTGDSGGLPSVLELIVSAQIAQGWLNAMLFGSLALAFFSWLALLLCAAAFAPGRGEAREHVWRRINGIAAAVIPLLLIAATASGALAATLQPDAAGDTASGVSARPIAEQATIAQERYEQTQEKLSDVRRIIADDGWIDRSNGLDDRWSDCRRAATECYSIVAGFSLTPEVDADGAEWASIEEKILALGWERAELKSGVYGDLVARDAAGVRLEVRGVSQADTVEVLITTPFWWGDRYEIFDELRGGDLDEPPAEDEEEVTYRAGEWPPLR